MVKYTLITTMLTLALFSGPAFAQSDSARLKRLENEIETLSRTVYKGEAPPASSAGASNAAQTELRISAIETSLRDLTGRLEEQAHQNKQIQDRLDRVLSELDRRMMDVEGKMRGAGLGGQAADSGLGAPVGVSSNGVTNLPGANGQSVTQMGGTSSHAGVTFTPPSNSTDGIIGIPPQNNDLSASGSSLPQPNSPSEFATGNLGSVPQSRLTGADSAPVALNNNDPLGLYESALGLLRSRNYKGAGDSFEAFIAKNPKHDLVPNAKYWLGESWYVRNDFEKSARIFAEAYQQNTKGPKAPDNLLKLALSLNGMGKKNEACLTLSQLKKEYAGSTSPILERAEQEAGRLGC
jgi:tol-pal system protein YbgF